MKKKNVEEKENNCKIAFTRKLFSHDAPIHFAIAWEYVRKKYHYITRDYDLEYKVRN